MDAIDSVSSGSSSFVVILANSTGTITGARVDAEDTRSIPSAVSAIGIDRSISVSLAFCGSMDSTGSG